MFGNCSKGDLKEKDDKLTGWQKPYFIDEFMAQIQKDCACNEYRMFPNRKHVFMCSSNYQLCNIENEASPL